MRFLRLLYLVFLTSPAWSQATTSADSVRVLREVRVTDQRLADFAGGDKVSSVLERTVAPVTHRGLADVLMQYSAVNVRSYGPAGLSTASLRGTGSNHTAVLWEGINLQSAMNGGLDLTLVPVSFVDDVRLQFGGAGALFGSGTLGGAIHLGSDLPNRQRGWYGQLHQQIGSFGQRYTGVNAGFLGPRTSTQIRVFDQQADYDYPFFNIYTQRDDRRRNAGIQQHGLLLEQDWVLSPTHQLSAKYWYQDNVVQVPGVAAAGGEAQATQHDVFHRAVLRWQHRQTRQNWQVRTALLHHRLAFNDPPAVQSDDQSVSWITEGEHTYYFSGEHWLQSGINHTYETATVDQYAAPVSRHRSALFASYRGQLLPTLEMSAGVRETLIDGQVSPFLPSVGLVYRPYPAWGVRAKVARSYRIPTFNDLYWRGGGATGNPDLVPEQGWSYELGIGRETQQNGSLTQASAAITVFSNHLDEWIQWLPDEANVWSPDNVQQVWSRGVELEGSLDHRFTKHWFAQLWTSYSYTHATEEKVRNGSTRDLHQQLVYTPRHQSKTSLTVQCRALGIGYTALGIGEQYTIDNQRRSLPAYLVHDISFNAQLRLYPRHQVQVSGQVRNLADRAYDVREGYPMPGRHYQLSLTYQFNQ